MTKNIKESIIKELQGKKYKSAWNNGVNAYALELLDQDIPEEAFSDVKNLKKALLNGADSWKQYSYGGCSLIYNQDIAERLCSPSEVKKRKYGKYRPNRYEEWLDVQARALAQAFNKIARAYKLFLAKVEKAKGEN